MGFTDKDGPILGKKCEQCKSRFPRVGASFGFIGEFICFLLFGGTSKYCPSCRASMKENGQKVDKGFLFRLIWLGVVVGILYVIVNAA